MPSDITRAALVDALEAEAKALHAEYALLWARSDDLSGLLTLRQADLMERAAEMLRSGLLSNEAIPNA